MPALLCLASLGGQPRRLFPFMNHPPKGALRGFLGDSPYWRSVLSGL